MALSPAQQVIGAAFGYQPLSDDDGEQPYPVDSSLAPSRLRSAGPADDAPDGWPMVSWHGGWWPAPTMEQMEEWAFDSVCETPDGSDVEPDDGGSWLSILGLI